MWHACTLPNLSPYGTALPFKLFLLDFNVNNFFSQSSHYLVSTFGQMGWEVVKLGIKLLWTVYTWKLLYPRGVNKGGGSRNYSIQLHYLAPEPHVGTNRSTHTHMSSAFLIFMDHIATRAWRYFVLSKGKWHDVCNLQEVIFVLF